MVIAFWNLQGKDLADTLVEFVNEKQVDVLILAEANANDTLDFFTKINKFRKFNQVSQRGNRLSIFSVYDNTVITDTSTFFSSTRWGAFVIHIPTVIKLNIIPVHFFSKVNWSDSSLAMECVNLSRDIKKIEANTFCQETIVIGDFNMNPFEDGIVSAIGLNAIKNLDYGITKKERIIDGQSYDYFYNPMWNFYGDNKPPFGTHYHRTSGHISQEWNIYDQIILRPSLKKHLGVNSVEIISEIATEKLTGKHGRPNKRKYSDHLPITLTLNL